MGAKEAFLTTTELCGGSDTLHELGRGALKVQPEGQEPVGKKVKEVVVWRHAADSWRHSMVYLEQQYATGTMNEKL